VVAVDKIDIVALNGLAAVIDRKQN